MFQRGVAGTENDWIRSYLTDRKQVVLIENISSNQTSIDYGVVQGSTLGPVLFLIYINNIIDSNITGNMLLFADNTAVYFEGESWQEVYKTASRGVLQLKDWFDNNILSMNISKTKVMPIYLQRNRALT